MNLEEINDRLTLLEQNISIQNDRIKYFKKELSDKDLRNYISLYRTSIGKTSLDGKIIYRNWWEGHTEHFWLTRFIRHKFPDADYKFNFFSVIGNHDNLTEDMPGKKIFFTGECLNKNPFVTHFNKTFGRYALDYMDLAMGYDVLSHPKYLRIPYWLVYNFKPEMTEEEIEQVIINWNSLKLKKFKDVGLVASHDRWNTRTIICKDVEKITSIDYGGRWRQNTNELKTKFKDNKVDFLNQYKFNICAENVNDDAYVSEKIFDAIKSDCIPLYLGGGNYLEPHVVNRKKILVWEENKDNSDNLELLRNLISDEKSFNEFRDQNYVLEDSYKFIYKKYLKLEKHFERLIYE